MVYTIYESVTENDQKYGQSQLIPLDGDYEKIFVEDPIPDGGAAMHERALDGGRQWTTGFVPTKFYRDGVSLERKPFAQVGTAWGTKLVITKEVRDVIEDMEPSVHQFFPVEIYIDENDPNANSTDEIINVDRDERDLKLRKIGDRFILNVCTRIDSMHKTESVALNEKGFYKSKLDKDKVGPIFSTKAIGSHHLWRDKFFHWTALWSDELFERVRDVVDDELRFERFIEK